MTDLDRALSQARYDIAAFADNIDRMVERAQARATRRAHSGMGRVGRVGRVGRMGAR